GLVGEALADGVGSVVGRLVYVVPPALLVIGALLVRGPSDDAEGEHNGSVKPIAGAVLLGLTAAGRLHLAGDRPTFGAPAADLRDAGGYLGVVVGGSMQQV